MRFVSTEAAPKPVAAYAQATVANGFVFVAGQLGVDPATGKLAEGIEAQATRALQNVGAILEAAGSGVAQIVRCTLYLTDLGQFSTVNGIYERFVGTHRPARVTIGVTSLPAGAAIEVDAIAVAG